MEKFNLFFAEGVQHITDLSGIDHILFIAALCLQYLVQDWKRLLVLVTAFTVGHSVTLALSSLHIVSFPTAITEFLIAVTIFITAVNNLRYKDQQSRHSRYIYILAVLFGLIHGLGFSTLLKSMLGKDAGIVMELLAFNVGIEVGQLVIVAVILIISFIFVTLLRIPRRAYVLLLSGGIAALSLNMAIERYPNKRGTTHEKTGFINVPGNDGLLYCKGSKPQEQSRV